VTRHALQGVLPVIATPFAEDWSIDRGELAAGIDFAFDQGAHGITVAMVSEIQRLATDEREALNAAATAAAAGRGPVILSVGAESTPIAVRLARGAADAGADAVMATPPLQGSTSIDELRRYLAAILDASRLPTILQDASSYVGAPIPSDTQAELVREFGPERLLLKPEAPPLGPTTSAIAEASGGTARIFDGSGGVALMDTHRRGIVGTMPGPDLVWALRALWDALESGDDARAHEISAPLTMLISMVTGLDGYVAFEKHMLVKQGVFSSTRMRGPVFYRIDAETGRLLDELFDRLRAAVG